MPTSLPIPSEPWLSILTDMSSQSRYSKQPKPSHLPWQQTPHAHVLVISESPNKIRPDGIEQPAKNDKQPFYHRFYHWFVDSYAEVEAKVSSFHFPVQFLSNRMPYGPSGCDSLAFHATIPRCYFMTHLNFISVISVN